MAFGRRPVEEIVTEETKVWECTSEECNGWVRDNFKSTTEPSCPLCGSEMETNTRLLQVVNNHNKSFLA
ncbi:cold-shock protein [Bacillus sp. JJ1533]|uniref:cold-shock protein n=1 Tax=Bacillus sp. JJ1533 TaxID=3122959 RepID=UPI0030005A3F